MTKKDLSGSPTIYFLISLGCSSSTSSSSNFVIISLGSLTYNFHLIIDLSLEPQIKRGYYFYQPHINFIYIF